VDQLLQETSRFGSKPIVSVWIGGNDIGAFTSGLSPDTSVAAYASALSRIVGTGVSDLLLFEIPDVGFTPLLQDFTPGADTAAASGATANLNTAFFDLVVASLPGSVSVTRINTFDLTQIAYENPAFFGAASAGPCTLSGQVLGECTQTTFWDPFHPTGSLHDFVANEVRAAGIAPVPLPAAGWMLLAALGALGFWRRWGLLQAA
jgi:phospholipase/lecithinase/hemolysin